MHRTTNLSPNRMANWVLASHHSRGGRFHSSTARLRTRYSSFIAASSPGKWPRVRTATDALEVAGSSSPRLDAELLLAALLGTRVATLRTAVAAGFPLPLPSSALLPEPEPLSERHPELSVALRAARAALAAGDAPAALAALVSERAKGRPVSHLTGTRGFRALELLVTPDVLDPRPESELLVETALAYLADRAAAARTLGRAPQPLNAAEIGTGSGAIALALVTESPVPLRFTATDLSGDALAVARANALRSGVASRVTFLHGDLAEPLLAGRAPGDPPHLDLLVANLPYVPTAAPGWWMSRTRPRRSASPPQRGVC